MHNFRHHTNPVGTEWRWKMDEPEMIVNEAIKNHRSMIKQFKGKILIALFYKSTSSVMLLQFQRYLKTVC